MSELLLPVRSHSQVLATAENGAELVSTSQVFEHGDTTIVAIDIDRRVPLILIDGVWTEDPISKKESESAHSELHDYLLNESLLKGLDPFALIKDGVMRRIGTQDLEDSVST